MPSLRRLAAVTAATLLLSAGSPTAAAGIPPRARAPAQKPLRIAMSGDYWPLHAETPDGGREGLEADLAVQLARLLGREPRFVGRKQTGRGAVEAVAAGKADVAIASITPTDERRKLVDFTRPYLVLRYRLAARAADGSGEDALPVDGRTVAAARGPAAAEARRLLAGANVLEAPSIERAVALVEARQADLVFGEDVGLVLALEGKALRVVGEPLGESPLAIAVPKGKAAPFDEALAKLSGAIAALVETYRPGEPAEVPEQVFLAVDTASERVTYRVSLGDLSIEAADDPPDDGEGWSAVPGDAPIQMSVGATREGTGVPAALARLLAGAVHDPKAASWVKLGDGTHLVFEKWRRVDECGGEELGENGETVEYHDDCAEEGYEIIAVRGGVRGSVTVTTLAEGT